MIQHVFQFVSPDNLKKNKNGPMFHVCHEQRTTLELSGACRSHQRMKISSNSEGDLFFWMTK